MDGVACFKQPTSLETDKKVNLIYGLNGTGKSTISRFLYTYEESPPEFSHCHVEGLRGDEELLVYNQQFINDTFYEVDSFPGVFTLSKANKEAEKRIALGRKTAARLEQSRNRQEEQKKNLEAALQQKEETAKNNTWEIKSNYAGGDRVLEYCLDGLKGSKDKLFQHILEVAKPSQQPGKTIETIKRDVEALSGEFEQEEPVIPLVEISLTSIEKDELLRKNIVGNEHSSVSDLYTKLGNSDWVKQGLSFLPEHIQPSGDECPFCQQKTITIELKKAIEEFFDESYERDITALNRLGESYSNTVSSIPAKASYRANRFIQDAHGDFENVYHKLFSVIEDNKKLIEQKKQFPSRPIDLKDTTALLKEFNAFLGRMNADIEVHNQKIRNRAATLKSLKDEFWAIMRWQYSSVIDGFNQESRKFKANIQKSTLKLEDIEKKTKKVQSIIREEQSKTVNIQDAVDHINNGLIELGIDGFKIEREGEKHYTLTRPEVCQNTFKTLSEGEKMIISFLYFREVCQGTRDTSSTKTKKILIIDDPISSLSHIFIFNIGRMIKLGFFGTDDYEQIFLLTHSLYFFYEMTEFDDDKRKERQRLFRLKKNKNGATISKMKYEEIQNDYHSFWSVIKDPDNCPALIANCMRNIIEYFFGFLEKESLATLFQKEQFKDNPKFQAFQRYMNRESHSLGQNLFDLSEFDYDSFLEAFKLVFEISGYENHYNRMMKKIG